LQLGKDVGVAIITRTNYGKAQSGSR
jgi:hypothetical protein